MTKLRTIITAAGVSFTVGTLFVVPQLAYSQGNDYTPLGIHKGSFYFFPVVELGIGYDDNVFRLPDSVDGRDVIIGSDGSTASVKTRQSDTAVIMRGSVAMNSDWNRHALNGLATMDLGKYSDLSSEDFGNYSLGLDGRLDVKRGNAFTSKIGTTTRNESRSSVDSREPEGNTLIVFGEEPTRYTFNYVGVGYKYNPARLGVSANLDYEAINYDDVTNIFGQNVDNSDRNRTRPNATARIGYELMPQRSLYIEGQVYNIDYDSQFDNNGIERSSTGYKTTAGMNFDLSNLLVGDVFVGYLEQNYDSDTQADISSSLFGMGLTWFPTRLTSIDFRLDRNVEESTEATASGYLSSTAGVVIKHELKRNIILTADADYTKNEFQQNVEGRKENENITGFGLEGRYLISRRWFTSLQYRRESRESDIAIQEYTDNRGLLTLGVNW